MGLFSRLGRRKALTADPAVVDALANGGLTFTPRLGGTNVNYGRIAAAFERSQAATYALMYAQQPAVRTVVDLISENVSQLGLKLYKRKTDTEREHVPDHPASETMRYPNPETPADRWIYDFVSDYLVYWNAYALVFRTKGKEQRTLVRVPAHRVGVLGPGYTVEAYRIYRSDGTNFDVDPGDILHWRGYNPDDPRLGLSPLETLRQVLVEDSVSQTASVELAKNGLQGGYIKRPLEAPEWSGEARGRFAESWRNMRSKTPQETPILEEGMEFENTVISPKDAELLAGREFTLTTVAQQYGVPVGMFSEDAARKEVRTAFYSDTLAPISKKLCSVLDLGLTYGEYDATDLYFEMSLNEKMRGDPAERFPAITAAVGAPWMIRDEARALENLPPLEEGGDEIVTPLNVQVGKNPLPAPNVMPPQDPNKPPQDGSHRENPKALPKARPDLLPQTLEAFYDRQHRVIKSRKGQFDSTRWNRELRQDLSGVVEPDLVETMAEQINSVTEIALVDHSVDEAFKTLRRDAGQWASDIDRARVLMVAQGLLDASASP